MRVKTDYEEFRRRWIETQRELLASGSGSLPERISALRAVGKFDGLSRVQIRDLITIERARAALRDNIFVKRRFRPPHQRNL